MHTTLPAHFLLFAPDLELIESGRRKPFITLASALFILAMLAALLPNLAKITRRKRCGGQILRTSFAIKLLFDLLLHLFDLLFVECIRNTLLAPFRLAPDL